MGNQCMWLYAVTCRAKNKAGNLFLDSRPAVSLTRLILLLACSLRQVEVLRILLFLSVKI